MRRSVKAVQIQEGGKNVFHVLCHKFSKSRTQRLYTVDILYANKSITIFKDNFRSHTAAETDKVFIMNFLRLDSWMTAYIRNYVSKLGIRSMNEGPRSKMFCENYREFPLCAV